MGEVQRVARLRGAVVLEAGFPLLSGLDLDVERGTRTVLLGANGAGKTSLLRLLGGLLALSDGEGDVLGVDLKRGPRRELRRRVGWLGHSGSFYDDLSVRENLLFAARALGRPSQSVDEALEQVGLSARSTTPTRSLSAGQRRRLGLAWLLARRAELWLLDEPVASLDDEARALVGRVLDAALEAGVTVVESAHGMPAMRTSPARVVRLGGGRVLEVS